MRDNTEKMQRLGMARFHRQNLPVEPLRLRQPRGLMVLEGKFKGLLERATREWRSSTLDGRFPEAPVRTYG